MTRAQDIIGEALTWVETPWQHQQRIKGVGVDCCNFITAIVEATGAAPDTDFERNYRRRADGVQMMAEILRYLEPVEHLDERGEVTLEHARLADVIVTHDGKNREAPKHMAFLSQLVDARGRDYPKMCHASERGVHNHRIDLHFKGLVHSLWRVPKLSYD